MQPIAAADVADAITDVALANPVNGIVEIAGPERVGLNEIIGRSLSAVHDLRTVVLDVHTHSLGADLNDQSLVPNDDVRFGTTRFEN